MDYNLIISKISAFLDSPSQNFVEFNGLNFQHFQPNTLSQLFNDIQQRLIDIQETRGPLIEVEGQRLRVYQPNSPSYDSDIRGIYQRGLSFIQGALVVMQNGVNFKDDTLKKINELTQTYLDAMSTIYDESELNEIQKYENAALLTDQLLGALTKLSISQSNDDAHQYKVHFANIVKACDLSIMLNPLEDGICTVRENSSHRIFELSFHSKISTDENQNYEDTGWFKKLQKKHGTWINNFFENNWAALSNRATLSSSRDLPNPANAWDEVIIHVNKVNSELVSIEHTGRMGITTPFEMKGKDERIKYASQSLMSVLEPQLEEIRNRRNQKWGDWVSKDNSIPILHATYVAPVAYGRFLGMKDSQFIKEKKRANEKVTKWLSESNFKLIELNNSINIHRHTGYKSQNDISSSLSLIAYGIQIIESASEHLTKEKNNIDLSPALNFLKSASTFPPRRRGPSRKEEKNINELYKNLNEKIESADSSLEDKQRYQDLKNLIQSSIALKRINHESWFSAPRRAINQRFKLARPITFILFAPFQALQYIFDIPNKVAESRYFSHPNSEASLKDKILFRLRPFSNTLLGGANKQTYKSAYELIIADSVGYSISGCKSALDRKGEVDIIKNALLDEMYLNKTPHFNFFNASSYYQFNKDHVKPVDEAGHQNRIVAAADFIGERKMHETRNEQFVYSSKDKKVKAKKGAAFRKPKLKVLNYLKPNNPFTASNSKSGENDSHNSNTGHGVLSSREESVSSSRVEQSHQPPLSSPHSLIFSSHQVVQADALGQLTSAQFEQSQINFIKHYEQMIKETIDSSPFIRAYQFENLSTLYIKKQDNDRVSLSMLTTNQPEQVANVLASQIIAIFNENPHHIANLTRGGNEIKLMIFEKCIRAGISPDNIKINSIEPNELKAIIDKYSSSSISSKSKNQPSFK